MDSFEKRALILSVGLMMIFVFALMYAVDKRNSDVPDCLPYDAAYTKARIVKLDDDTYQVFCVARMWRFEPESIVIPVGSNVDFFVTSDDVVHGFNIYLKNVNMMAVHGGISKSTVHFDKPGIYKITCHEFCGSGHQNMQAEVVVTEKK